VRNPNREVIEYSGSMTRKKLDDPKLDGKKITLDRP